MVDISNAGFVAIVVAVGLIGIVLCVALLARVIV